MEIIGTIKRYMPDVSITADCIVGFPGETEEQFENTLSLMESVSKVDAIFELWESL